MDIIGIICEYNPFHHGHAYHIQKVKEMFPNSLIILILNGYFLERGEISVLNKETKTKIALKEGVDIVIELPFIFGSNSADIFAESAVTLLNYLKVQKIVFGSETNDIELLTKIAKKQLDNNFDQLVKAKLAEGVNYPTALNKAIDIKIDTPNDLLGIAYIKAILKNNFDITPLTIQRTNDYHDKDSNARIISASNIRAKVKNNINVEMYTDYSNYLNHVDDKLLFNLIKYKVISDTNLSSYLTVDEGIEHKLIKEINLASDLDDYILKVKSKRYTYNRIQRMLIHILVGLTKEDKLKAKIEYIKLLGFNENGKMYINKIKKELNIPLMRKISETYLTQQYELKAALIYDLITHDKTIKYELANKPIKNIDLK